MNDLINRLRSAHSEKHSNIRKPIGDEDAWFKQNPHVAGYADFENNTVVLNPYSRLTPSEKRAAALNEQTRLEIRRRGGLPAFAITPASFSNKNKN